MDRKSLIDLAQSIRTDERHWTLTDVADRADNAANLADAVLSFFEVEENSCSEKCPDCSEHIENLGGPAYA